MEKELFVDLLHRLQPAFKDYLWGGSRLKESYGKRTEMTPLAESWELSTHPDGESRVEANGETLTEYFRNRPEAIGEASAHLDRFPLLVKFIDAQGDLSVQVHPDDTYALEHEHEFGKTELWHLVDTAPGAFIYYGFKREVTQEEFVRAIEEETLCDLLRRVEVKKGDTYLLPAGTIHAIGAGCLITEVQQNSNSTYRVFDYGRRDKEGKLRQLHVEKAIDVTKLGPVAPLPDAAPHLAKTPYFTVDLLELRGETHYRTDGRSFRHFLALDEQVEITALPEGGKVLLNRGEGALGDAPVREYVFSGNGRLLISFFD